MRNIILLSLIGALATSVMAAEPKDQVQAAAKKLGEQANYSWTSNTRIEGMQFDISPMQCKTEKDGFTCLSQEFNNETYEAVLKGEKAVVKTDEGWKTTEELRQSGQGGQGGFNPARMMAMIVTNIKRPVEDVQFLAGKVKALKTGEADVISGDLTEDGAKELLMMGRRGRPGGNPPPPPKDAKGSVKFWLKDGSLAKYEVHVEGTVVFGQDQQERNFGRTMTVEIKDVGKTKVEAPEEAKKKLTT